MATLDQSVETILDAIVDAIQDVVDGSGSPIADVKSVVRGDRARPMPVLPSVWVVPQPAQFEQQTYEDETWTMPISIAALVKSDDPAAGGKAAQRIAALARAAALGARPFEESSGEEIVQITDIVSQSFDPTARSSERNRTLFWCDATVRVTFTCNG